MIRMERSELQHFSSYRHGAQLCQPNLTILVLASNPREPAIDLVHSSRLLWQESFYCNILSVCMYCQWRLSKAAQHAVYLSPAPSPHPNRIKQSVPFCRPPRLGGMGSSSAPSWTSRGAAAEYHPRPTGCSASAAEQGGAGGRGGVWGPGARVCHPTTITSTSSSTTTRSFPSRRR